MSFIIETNLCYNRQDFSKNYNDLIKRYSYVSVLVFL